MFSLDSPLITFVSPAASNFTQGREISPTNPITLTVGNSIQSTIHFLAAYQIKQLNLITSKPINSFNASIGTNPTVLTATLNSTANGSYKYVIVIPPALDQRVTQIAVVITISQTTNITGFTIEACTCNNMLLMNETISLLFILYPSFLWSV